METINLKIIYPFSPAIAKVKIPNDLLLQLNNYTEEVILNKQRVKKLDHGHQLAGNVTQEIRIEPEIGNKIGWMNFLVECTKNYVKLATNKDITKFDLIDSWIVRQFAHEYNPIHFHSGHLSGAGFLKLPNTMGEQYQSSKDNNENGNLQLIHGSKFFTNNPTYNIKPEVGDFYLFPNYLLHCVYPFRQTKEERRSISFNAYIDESIYRNS